MIPDNLKLTYKHNFYDYKVYLIDDYQGFGYTGKVKYLKDLMNYEELRNTIFVDDEITNISEYDDKVVSLMTTIKSNNNLQGFIDLEEKAY